MKGSKMSDNKNQEEGIITLSPLAQSIIDKSIDNVTKKLVGGAKNKKNSQPNCKKPSAKTTIKDTLNAATAKDTLEASNRGQAWKEMIQKSFSHGICSLATMKFDGQFKVKKGEPEGLEKLPKKPGVYVVYDKSGCACYVGDAGNLKKRWVAGHLNENKQKKKNNEQYKLSNEFEEGCTVKFIECESVETAAAIEANIIRESNPRVNAREELKTEQGTRSNQEAKKIKDHAYSSLTLVEGAAIEGLKQGGWNVLETFLSESIKCLKDEMVDIFKGGKAKLIVRIERYFKKIWNLIADIVKKPVDFLKGVFEFIVNAFSQAISKIYNLAKNIYTLGVSAWQLYNGRNTMTKEELIKNISETMIISSSLILWDSLDLLIETELTVLFPVIQPFAPIIAAIVSAIGFGITSHSLCGFVPKIVSAILSFETGHHKAAREIALASRQIVINCENNFILVNDLGAYYNNSSELCKEMYLNANNLKDNQPAISESVDLFSEVNKILKV